MAGNLGILQERGLESIGRFYSIYRGVVIDDKDPEGLNRLKLVIPEVTSYEVSDWAFPRNQDGGITMGFKGFTPKIGSIVFVEFKNGDPLYPIWSYHGWGLSEVPEELKDNDTMGIVTPSNHKLLINDKDGVISLSMSGDDGKEILSIVVNKNGNIDFKGNTMNLLGSSHGIPLSDLVVSRLNTIENEINSLKQAISSSLSNVKPSDGGLSAFTTLVNLFSSQSLKLTEISDIESKTVKQ